jgi:hypothetical protein
MSGIVASLFSRGAKTIDFKFAGRVSSFGVVPVHAFPCAMRKIISCGNSAYKIIQKKV